MLVAAAAAAGEGEACARQCRSGPMGEEANVRIASNDVSGKSRATCTCCSSSGSGTGGDGALAVDCREGEGGGQRLLSRNTRLKSGGKGRRGKNKVFAK